MSVLSCFYEENSVAHMKKCFLSLHGKWDTVVV